MSRNGYVEAQQARAHILDAARSLYPGVDVAVVRNHREQVHIKGVGFNACVIARREGARLVPLLFDKSWDRLHALVVDAWLERRAGIAT